MRPAVYPRDRNLILAVARPTQVLASYRQQTLCSDGALSYWQMVVQFLTRELFKHATGIEPYTEHRRLARSFDLDA